MNKEDQKKYNRQYYIKNKDKIKKSTKEWIENNVNLRPVYSKTYIKKNRDKINKAEREYRKTMPDFMVVKYITRHWKFSKKNIVIPKWFIDLYRANLFLKRELWEIRKNGKA